MADAAKKRSIWSYIWQSSILAGNVMCFVTTVVLCLYVTPKVQATVAEMLAGEPLPVLTRWVFSMRLVPLVLSLLLVIVSSTILALTSSAPRLMSLINTLLLIFHCLMIGLAIFGLYLPYIKITEHLG